MVGRICKSCGYANSANCMKPILWTDQFTGFFSSVKATKDYGF